MRKFMTFLGSASVLVVITFIISVKFFAFVPEHSIIHMERGWTVIYHNQNYLNTNLESMSRQLGKTFDRGDMITLYQTETLKDLDVPFPYLFFKSQFCTYDVCLDNKTIFSNHHDPGNRQEFTGIGYSFIPMPRDYGGKRLSIKLYVTENGTRADLITPMLGNYDDLYRHLLHSAMYPFITGAFLIVFGVVFLFVSTLFFIRTSGVSTQVYCSFLTIVLGSWILTAYNTLDYIIDPAITSTIEYCSMFLMTPLIYLIVYDLHKRSDNKIIMIMGLATLAFSILFMLLHFLNVVHINHFLKPFYFISGFGLILLFVYDYVDIKNRPRNSSTRILMIGVTLLTLSLIVYAFIAISMIVTDYRQSFLLGVIIPSGSMVFVITQLLNYFVYMTHTFAQKKEYAALTKIAYIDNLTGLPNRVSSDEKMSEFDKSDYDFCLVSLDLNGLKEVNDNSGHPAGDRLLKSFSEALAETFKDVGVCCRVGGDEFIIHISSIEKEKLDRLLSDLDKRLLQLDDEDQEINHSVSYGYAFRSETKERDTHSVFMLADQRMYNYKNMRYAHMTRR
ncbi:MAG: GGDEF domain-containing protein [Butyrivibrio sp.]|nr:GGDEF domain-containing protein [Butyrivibrio sp.]